jgi:hypothetical protein
MTVELGFFKNWNVVRDDLESAAARCEQGDGRRWKPLTKLGRQTGGPRFVVSHVAVFDRDVHGNQLPVASGQRIRMNAPALPAPFLG